METPEKKTTAEETAEEVVEETTAAEAEETVAEEAEETVRDAADTLSEEEEKLRIQLADINDRYVRLMAEFDNFRKRTSEEKNAIYSQATADAYADLFPILDNFERAFENADASPEDFRKGVDMIYQQVLTIFEKAGVESFGEPGDTFDPTIHTAVMHVEDESKGENEIIAVFQKGYRMGDKILRYAMVKVAN